MIRNILIAAGATLLFASPSFAAPTASAHARAKLTYDCTKAGNANKTACKKPATTAAKPAPAAKPVAAVTKTTKTTKVATKTKTARCRLANGRFAKCGTPGAKPA